mgnify:CR=1 FL=1
MEEINNCRIVELVAKECLIVFNYTNYEVRKLITTKVFNTILETSGEINQLVRNNIINDLVKPSI